MTSPRLIATDLDGTLLDSSGAISPRTRRALRAAKEAGAEIVFVTARPPRSIRQLAEAAGVTGTAVCSNGALVFDLDQGEVTATYALDPEAARKVAGTLREALPGLGFAVETGWRVLAEPEYGRPTPWDDHVREELAELERLWVSGEPIAKLLAWSPTHSVDEAFAAAIAAVEGQAEITHSGGRGLLEISAPGVTKAGTLAVLCEERGIDPADVVAFGDMPNDLAVLAFAGAGYAMANAHPSVLAAIPRRTLSNDEHGVAAVLEELFVHPTV